MKKYFITGASSGIGKALALEALDKGHRVVGFSRRQSIQHEHYKHVSLDLADMGQYVNITFETLQGAEEVILINNAGTLGDVKPVSRLDPAKVAESYMLNITAPTVLCKLFIAHTEEANVKRSILNISSGVSQYPIPSWSTYCASKAALDMFSRVLKLDHPDVEVFSIAPGIVDTEMQGEIRGFSERDFPELERFVQYKKQGELAKVSEVAEKLHYVLDHPGEFKELCFSVSDVRI